MAQCLLNPENDRRQGSSWGQRGAEATTDAVSPGAGTPGKERWGLQLSHPTQKTVSAPSDVPVMVDSGLLFPREDGQTLSSDCHLWALMYT